MINKVELPTQNFGIVIENNPRLIVEWFRIHGYDTWKLNGNGTNDSFYYVLENKEVDCFYSKMDEIKLYTLKEIQDMENQFVLPEKWLVKVTNENVDIINDWKQKSNNKNHAKDYDYVSYEGGGCSVSALRNYPEITFEQFQQYVLNSNQNKEMKEIIGYICPQDLFNGAVPKGTIFEKTSSSGMTMYPKNSSHAVPKEIVETWEPVSKEDEYKVGDWVMWKNQSSKEVYKVLAIGTTNFKVDHEYGNYSGNINSLCRVATTEEVKAHLLHEAYKFGFTEGANYFDSFVGNEAKVDVTKWEYLNGSLYNNGNQVYNGDKWATIKPQKEVVSVGGKFDVTIDGDKIYHKSDDITTFVKQLISHHIARIGIGSYGSYKATVGDIVFSATGCQKVETKLSDWKKVLDMYNKLQK